MTIQVINTGTSANSGNGDSLRVAFTKINNNFAELSGSITLQSFDQSLNTTDNVTFNALNVTSGTIISRTLSAGGYPLDSNGQALIRINNTQSPALFVSNYVPNQRAELIIRAYGKNRPGGTTVTSGSALIGLESSRGSESVTLGTKTNDILGYIGIGGHDGQKWVTSDKGLPSGSIGWQSIEDWDYRGNTTTNAGSRMFMQIHPPGIEVSATSIMNYYTQTWTTNTNGPPSLNIINGAVTNPLLVSSNGTDQYLGYGSSFFIWQNGSMALHGVPIHDSVEFVGNIAGTTLTVESVSTGTLSIGQQIKNPGVSFDTRINGFISGSGGVGTYSVNINQNVASSNMLAGPDNYTIRGKNTINIIGHRTNSVLGRRNPLMVGDHLGQYNFRGQTLYNSITNGEIGTSIISEAMDNFSTTTYGARLLIDTVHSGTTILSNRLSLDNIDTKINSDTITLSDASANTIAVFSTASTILHTSLLPSADLTYDLGSTSSQWHSLYVGTGTIYIGGIAISVSTANNVTVNGDPIITINTSGSLTVQGGDTVIGSVIVSSTAPSATTTGSLWFNDIDARTYIAYNGQWLDASPAVVPPASTYLGDIDITNSTLNINGSTLTIENGTLLINGSDIANNNTTYIPANPLDWSNSLSVIVSTFGEGLDQLARRMVVVESSGGGGGVSNGWQLTSSTAVLSLDETGTLTFPGGYLTYSTSTLGSPALIISTGTAFGFIAHGAGGALALEWVEDDMSNAAAVIVNAPWASTGSVQILTGSPQGPVSTSIWDFGNNGILTLSTASTILGNSTDPNVYIETVTTATTSTWTFGTDGVLTLPADTSVIKGGSTGTDVMIMTDNGVTTSTWTFGTDGTFSLPEVVSVGAAVVQPAGNGYNLKLISNGNVWNFDTTGRTTFPVATAPAHSTGAAGDTAGMVAFDSDYIYYCKQTYTSVLTTITLTVNNIRGPAQNASYSNNGGGMGTMVGFDGPLTGLASGQTFTYNAVLYTIQDIDNSSNQYASIVFTPQMDGPTTAGITAGTQFSIATGLTYPNIWGRVAIDNTAF